MPTPARAEASATAHAKNPRRRAQTGPTGATTPPNALEKAPVKERLLDVCAHYLGAPGRWVGSRVAWRCPRCAKEKFEAHPTRGVAGCWNDSCEVPTSTDAPGLVAFFEGLNNREDFPEVLRKGHEILGSAPTTQSVPAAPPPGPPRTDDPELLDAVYRAYLGSCPLARRDRLYWRSRGLTPRTVRAAGLASTSARTTAAAMRVLETRFGKDRLLSVPGFFENRAGRLSFTLNDYYALIPFHDRRGRVSTIEGRYAGPDTAAPLAKYVSLRDSGSHLYVHPAFSPDDLIAFCEGPVGALLAAQEGLPVGAISGFRNHRAPDGGPLPELAGANLAGRTVPYVPDLDRDPPRPEVLREAPKAARNLTEPQNGRPALVWLPTGAKDLDEWLPSLPRRRRRRAFLELLAEAVPISADAS